MKKLNKREKIMMGVSIVSIGALGVLGFKYLDTKKTIELLTKEKEGVNDRLNFVEFLVIESDCVPKALQNAENKLARKESKIKGIVDAMVKHPGDKGLVDALSKHEKEADILRNQIAKTYKLNELIINDENIYAK